MKSNINGAKEEKLWFLHSAAGACSGALTRLISQPFDVIKIRFQLQVEPLSKKSNNSKYKSIYQSIYTIHKEEGIKALWKGHLPGQFLSITYGLTQFLVFQKSLECLSITEKELNQSSSAHFMCGMVAASAATLTSYPFDVVRTRLVAQKSNLIYKNMRQVAVSIYKTEGISAYFRGFYPTLLQNSLQAFNNDYLNSVKQFSSGFLSGIASKTLVYPLDVAKKRLQLQDFIHSRDGFGKKFICNGLLDCVRLTIKDESIFGLFKGLSPSLLKAGCVTALHLTFYEQTYNLIHSLVKIV